MKVNFLIFIVCLTLGSCEPPTQTYKFLIINNSDKDLYFYEAVINAPIYPDTLIRETKVQLKVWANTTSHQGGIISTEEVFRRHNIDTLSIYFFDAETVDNTPWEAIREEYKVL